MTYALSEDSDQPGHPPSLFRVFAVGSKGTNISSCGQRRLLSDWADDQADLNLRWAHRSFCLFVMLWLKWVLDLSFFNNIWLVFFSVVLKILFQNKWSSVSLKLVHNRGINNRVKRIWYLSPSEQRRFRRACAFAQSRQNLRCSLIQAVSQEEPSDRKPDPKPLWMAGHAQLKFVMTECSKTQIRLTGLKWWINVFIYFCDNLHNIIQRCIVSQTVRMIQIDRRPEE